MGRLLKQAVLCTWVTLWSCSTPKGESRATSRPATVPQAKSTSTAQATARRSTCAGLGPLAPDQAPAAGQAALCEQIRKALVGRPHRDDVPREEQETVSMVERCGDPVASIAAPSGSALSSVMIVNVVGELGEVPAEGSYLVAQRPDGLCLVDRVLTMEWYHGGHFETDFDLQFSDAQHLTVRAHRLKRVPLDQQQPAEKGADIDWEACDQLQYERSDAGLRRTQARSEEGACPAR